MGMKNGEKQGRQQVSGVLLTFPHGADVVWTGECVEWRAVVDRALHARASTAA